VLEWLREGGGAFVAVRRQRGVPVTLRDTRGSEIDGACGQLAAREETRS